MTTKDLRLYHSLWEACRRGNEAEVFSIVGKFNYSKLNINLGGGSEKKNALHYATDAGYIQVVRVLVEDGHADINSVTRDRRTALHMAAGNDYYDIVSYLLSRRGIGYKIRDKSGKLAFHCTHIGQIRNLFRDRNMQPIPRGYKDYF